MDKGGDEGEESSSPALFFFFCPAGLLVSAHKFQNNHVYSCLLFYICFAVGRTWKWNEIRPITVININTFGHSASGQHIYQARHEP